jgi:hypothetical protein
MKRVIIVFFIALLFCNEEEIYTFVNNINEGHRVKYKQDDIMTFEMPGAGQVKRGVIRLNSWSIWGNRESFS